MSFKVNILCVALILPFLTAPVHAVDGFDDAFIVSNGVLVVDADKAMGAGIEILDASGSLSEGVVVLRTGLSLWVENQKAMQVDASPSVLAALDTNNDNRIDEEDLLWDAMYLAVDYNKDGVIVKGEYALIGNCGVDALQLDLEAGKVWSLHTDGSTKVVRTPLAQPQ